MVCLLFDFLVENLKILGFLAHQSSLHVTTWTRCRLRGGAFSTFLRPILVIWSQILTALSVLEQMNLDNIYQSCMHIQLQLRIYFDFGVKQGKLAECL